MSKTRLALGYHKSTEVGDGITHIHCHEFDGSRYRYDDTLGGLGFRQYDTDQDAWYFGVWVNISQRIIFTYAEGDTTETRCDNPVVFVNELMRLREFYGSPPRSYRVISEDGTVVDHYTPRPGDDIVGKLGATSQDLGVLAGEGEGEVTHA
jgi:hypothetical protein